ncbi:hypothetical protein BH23CHL2_BH23CHL2_35560 [soil metagenome]
MNLSVSLGLHRKCGRAQLRGDTIIMNTARGRKKERNIRADPRVSLCWEDKYRFVSINGTVTEMIDDPDQALADIFSLARRYNPGVSDEDIDHQFSNFRQEERITIVVSIDSMILNGF